MIITKMLINNIIIMILIIFLFSSSIISVILSNYLSRNSHRVLRLNTMLDNLQKFS